MYNNIRQLCQLVCNLWEKQFYRVAVYVYKRCSAREQFFLGKLQVLVMVQEEVQKGLARYLVPDNIGTSTVKCARWQTRFIFFVNTKIAEDERKNHAGNSAHALLHSSWYVISTNCMSVRRQRWLQCRS